MIDGGKLRRASSLKRIPMIQREIKQGILKDLFKPGARLVS